MPVLRRVRGSTRRFGVLVVEIVHVEDFQGGRYQLAMARAHKGTKGVDTGLTGT